MWRRRGGVLSLSSFLVVAAADPLAGDHAACFTSGQLYRPSLRPATVEDSAQLCQLTCARTRGCAHFGYFLENRHCLLQPETATLATSRDWAVVSGPPLCPGSPPVGEAEEPLPGAASDLEAAPGRGAMDAAFLRGPLSLAPAPCVMSNVRYAPDLPGGVIHSVASEQACQALCFLRRTSCAHFGYWLEDRVCRLQGSAATAVAVVDCTADQSQPCVDVVAVRSGPPNCPSARAFIPSEVTSDLSGSALPVGKLEPQQVMFAVACCIAASACMCVYAASAFTQSGQKGQDLRENSIDSIDSLDSVDEHAV